MAERQRAAIPRLNCMPSLKNTDMFLNSKKIATLRHVSLIEPSATTALDGSLTLKLDDQRQL